MSNSTTPPKVDSEQLLKELVLSVKMKTTDRFFTSYSSEQISNAFLAIHYGDSPFEQTVSVCETLFELLLDKYEEDLPQELQKSIWQLYKLFRIYSSLALEPLTPVTHEQ